MRVKFADLVSNDPEELNIIRDILKSGVFVRGSRTQAFQESFMSLVGGEGYCVGVSSGNSALIASLRAMQIKLEQGTSILNRKVLVPAMSFASTMHAVVEAGFEPVFCDVLSNGLLDQGRAVEIIKRHQIPMAIFVHLYGRNETLSSELLQSCFVIEDAAQCVPLSESVQGEVACFSFYPSKNLGSVGDAGAVVTKRKGIADIISAYIDYGRLEGTHHPTTPWGNNMRISEIQAGILSHRISKVSYNNDMRRLIARTYIRNEVHSISAGSSQYKHVWHLYPILVEKPDEFIEKMNARNIEVGKHYPYTLPQLYHGDGKLEFPTSTHIAKHVVTLPLGPHMHAGQAMQVVAAVASIAEFDEEQSLWRIK